MKTCKDCGQKKEDLEFSTSVGRTTGREHLNNVCRACITLKQKDTRLEYHYGISRGQWELILKSQDGKCKICGEILAGKIDTDHDHKTQVVRGLLCNGCNVGLGRFKEDPIRLRAAANYVERKPNALKELVR